MLPNPAQILCLCAAVRVGARTGEWLRDGVASLSALILVVALG